MKVEKITFSLEIKIYSTACLLSHIYCGISDHVV